MKLYHSPLSPFARKCRIIIRAKELDVEEIKVGPDGANGYAADVNPLGKVPCLERGGSNVALFDSPLICEYLDSLKDPWLSNDGEVVRDESLHWPDMIERHDTAIKSVVGYLDEIIGYVPTKWSFGSVAVVCALDYADFRADHIGWRKLAPNLAAWHEGIASLAEYKATYAYDDA